MSNLHAFSSETVYKNHMLHVSVLRFDIMTAGCKRLGRQFLIINEMDISSVCGWLCRSLLDTKCLKDKLEITLQITK